MNLSAERDILDSDNKKHHYIINKLTGRKSFYYQFKILSIVGCAIKDGGIDVMSFLELKKVLDSNVSDIITALGRLLYSFEDTDKIIDLMLGLFADCAARRDSDELSEPLIFDRIFTGENVFEAYKAVKFILEANFVTEGSKNFFSQAITNQTQNQIKNQKVLHEESKKA